MLPLGEREPEPLKPAEIGAALVNCDYVAAYLNLVAMPGLGLLNTSGDAVQFVIVDEFGPLATQVNLAVDALVDLETLRQSLGQASGAFGGEKMLNATSAFWTGVQILSLSGAACVSDWRDATARNRGTGLHRILLRE